ncbi:hypothetical protein HU200_065852 [Digitaria exilis]|uniref:Uncharacterized protein n=1 Tax=Digitaria exilis TaxID=1010633 RepID=A0A834ZZF3_9POAL|nr:hypothetical protein HU200_065852 [Digitaria exilis]
MGDLEGEKRESFEKARVNNHFASGKNQRRVRIMDYGRGERLSEFTRERISLSFVIPARHENC